MASFCLMNVSHPFSSNFLVIEDTFSFSLIVFTVTSPFLSLFHRKIHTPPFISTPGKQSEAFGISYIIRILLSFSISSLKPFNSFPPAYHLAGIIMQMYLGLTVLACWTKLGYMGLALAPYPPSSSWYGGLPMITSNCISLWNISLIDLWIKG